MIADRCLNPETKAAPTPAAAEVNSSSSSPSSSSSSYSSSSARRARGAARGVPGTKYERLLLALYEARIDLSELAQQEKLTLVGLARWANDPETVGSLEGLCRLNDVRAQLLVSRYRTLAAARLFDLTKEENGGELARRACVDLLKVSLIPINAQDLDGSAAAAAGTSGRPAALPPLDESTVRTLLAEFGREGGEEPEPQETRNTGLPAQGHGLSG